MRESLEQLLTHWENDESLASVRQFRGRSKVLDRLDAHSPEWMETTLEPRARKLCERLEAANEELYEAIRNEIEQGVCPRMFAELLESPSDPRGIGFDELDELVSGVLRLDEPVDMPLRAGPESVFYQPTPARHIFALIAAAAITASDVVVDLGSGLGHVPLLVSACTGAHAMGVELEPDYVKSARECARRLNLSRVSFVEADARNADYANGTVFYLYTPFTGSVLGEVMDALQEQAAARAIRVCTFGPCSLVAGEEPWLEAMTTQVTDRVCVFVGRR